MLDAKAIFLESALELLGKTDSECIFLFLNTKHDCEWFLEEKQPKENIILVLPHNLNIEIEYFESAGLRYIKSWAGNQSRFSRIKYAFMQGVLGGFVSETSKVICVLGPSGTTSRLDTMTIHDLALSWSEEFPFDPRDMLSRQYFHIVMAMVDIAFDLGTSGREGKSVGTTFIIGDTERVLHSSHQAVFNPFKGYRREELYITIPEVVESIKELAQIDGAILISEDGCAVAAGRHLDITSASNAILSRGLGSRHRSAAGITAQTSAVAIVVSASTGKITIFEQGKTIAELETVTGRRLV